MLCRQILNCVYQQSLTFLYSRLESVLCFDDHMVRKCDFFRVQFTKFQFIMNSPIANYTSVQMNHGNVGTMQQYEILVLRFIYYQILSGGHFQNPLYLSRRNYNHNNIVVIYWKIDNTHVRERKYFRCYISGVRWEFGLDFCLRHTFNCICCHTTFRLA